MRRTNRSIRILLALLAAASIAPIAIAQSEALQSEADGPGRSVARLSLLNGDVSVRRGDSQDWVAAAVNAPLMAEDRVLTGPGSRSEVQLDYYNRVRLAASSEVRLAEVEEKRYQLQIARGTVAFAALPGSNDQVELATPAASLRPLAAGSYRISVYDDGTTEFTVRRGEAEIYTPRGTRHLQPGQTMYVRLSGDNMPEFRVEAELRRDAFDEFNEQRDRELSRVKSYQYVSRDVYGAEDLDSGGEWVDQAPYGRCWRPYATEGWAPYRNGRWSWMDYYGWTWVSYDPWGWAPYHYGRWFSAGSSWFWYPGGMYERAYWRPGLVAFFGFGGFGVGFGHFGWVPLAPFEPFHAWWGRGHGGGYRQSIVNNINISNTYRNARFNNGVTTLTSSEFQRGAVGRGMGSQGAELRNASVMHGALPLAPGRESLRLSDRAVRSDVIASASRNDNQRFVASRQPVSGGRVPFEQQRAAYQQSTMSASNQAGGARAAEVQNGSSGRGGQSGWRQASPSSQTSSVGREQGTSSSPAAATGGRSTNDSRGGWGTFGTPSGGRGSGTVNSTAPASAYTGGRSNADVQRGGWSTFGSPDRSATPASSARGGWNTGAAQSEASRSSAPSVNGGSWRGETRSSGPGWSTGSSPASRSESPRSTGGWSAGSSRSENPRFSEPARSPGNSGGGSGYSSPAQRSYGGSAAPRYSAPAQQYSAPAPRSAPSGGQRSAPSHSSGGGGGRSSSSSSGHSSRR